MQLLGIGCWCKYRLGMAQRQLGNACFACACWTTAGTVKVTNAHGMGTDVALDVTSALTSFTLLFQPRPSAFLGSCLSTKFALAIWQLLCFAAQRYQFKEVQACFLRSDNTAGVFCFLRFCVIASGCDMPMVIKGADQHYLFAQHDICSIHA